MNTKLSNLLEAVSEFVSVKSLLTYKKLEEFKVGDVYVFTPFYRLFVAKVWEEKALWLTGGLIVKAHTTGVLNFNELVGRECFNTKFPNVRGKVQNYFLNEGTDVGVYWLQGQKHSLYFWQNLNNLMVRK